MPSRHDHHTVVVPSRFVAKVRTVWVCSLLFLSVIGGGRRRGQSLRNSGMMAANGAVSSHTRADGHKGRPLSARMSTTTNGEKDENDQNDQTQTTTRFSLNNKVWRRWRAGSDTAGKTRETEGGGRNLFLRPFASFIERHSWVDGREEKMKMNVTNDLHRIKTLSSSSDDVVENDWKKRLQQKRDQLMVRASLVSSWLLWKHDVEEEEDANGSGRTGDGGEALDPDAITQQSNLKSTTPRPIHIVTTAALPWYTGTAINPLLRAAYLYQTLVEHYQQREQEYQQEQQQELQEQHGLCRGGGGRGAVMSVLNGKRKENNDNTDVAAEVIVSVTLVIPWLERPQDQEHLYHQQFSSPKQQVDYIRAWLRDEAGLPDAAEGLQILCYPARYHKGLRSIFAMGDLIQDVILKHTTPDQLDVCILEEPEHCNWFRAPGDGWTQQFQYVVGIIHTSKPLFVENTDFGTRIVFMTLSRCKIRSKLRSDNLISMYFCRCRLQRVCSHLSLQWIVDGTGLSHDLLCHGSSVLP